MRAAVPANSAAFSDAEAPAAMRLNAFQVTAKLDQRFCTGKLLSNMQRSAPNSSMLVCSQGFQAAAISSDPGGKNI